jgi:hypothetical protein
MNATEFQSPMARRLFLARLGAGAGVVKANVIRSLGPEAQGAVDAPWRAARHPQDDWYDEFPGVHRFLYLFDISTAESMGWAL